jgi:hypothetical protein
MDCSAQVHHMFQIKAAWRLRFKAYTMLWKYYSRSIFRRAFSLVPIVLFSISIIMFLLVLIPATRIRLRNSSILLGVPGTFQVSGTVYESIKSPGQPTRQQPIAGVTVEGGGVRTTTNAIGSYDLQFAASEPNNLPLIFTYHGREFITRVSLSLDTRTLHQDFTVAQ